MMNDFLPTSLPVLLSMVEYAGSGDSLAVAQRLADMVGIDYYPHQALMTIGNKTLHLDGGQSFWHPRDESDCLLGLVHTKKNDDF